MVRRLLLQPKNICARAKIVDSVALERFENRPLRCYFGTQRNPDQGVNVNCEILTRM